MLSQYSYCKLYLRFNYTSNSYKFEYKKHFTSNIINKNHRETFDNKLIQTKQPSNFVLYFVIIIIIIYLLNFKK